MGQKVRGPPSPLPLEESAPPLTDSPLPLKFEKSSVSGKYTTSKFSSHLPP